MSAQEVTPVKVTRELPVKLGQAELANIAKEIGRLSKQRGELEAQAKQVASHWKDRIAGVDAQIHDLAQRADEGVEPRPVDCEEQRDYRLGEVRVVRLDTKETLEVRPMTADERQPSLPIAEEPAEKKKGGKKKKRDEEVEAAPPVADEHADLPPGTEIEDPGYVLDDGDEA